MKKSAYIRFSVTLFLLISLLSPAAVFAAGEGKKRFKQGMVYEYSEEWDKAVEEFALAVADNPKNPEYRLHYIRALFNASQMFMKQGKSQAELEDYAGAYVSFRKAYGYDPVNELAKSEMARMVRLQKGTNGGDSENKAINDGVKLVQTSFNGITVPKDFAIPQQLEKLRDVPFPNPVDLQWLIKELSKDLDLNVLFDQGSRLEARKIKIELKNVTSAKALDYVFLQENLFFQKVGPRTILIADGNQRQKFQQLVLRTYYLANASPKDVENVIKTAIPAQPGRTPTIVLKDDATNSVTVRDTSENIRLIGKLITSLDKDRAEVVMDVQIFEVSKSDLLRLGSQIGNLVGPDGSSSNELLNLGGIRAGAAPIRGDFGGNLPLSIASGIAIPSVVLSAFQSKSNTKLLASTQIHAFNNEDSSARIGQRVPVRTASVLPFGSTGGNNQNNGFGNGFPVINYEQVGLTLKFKPLVFPNQDVQVTMEIESKDRAAGPDPFTPVFTERTIKGTARVQNNKTLLLASVAQGVETDGRSGIPILGSLPIIGRLFATPNKENSQVDIVIAVTPRVIRAPAILPEDLEERETGSLAVPTSSSLEAMVIQEEIEEQLAAARRLGNTAQVLLPDQQPIDEPVYVRSDAATSNAKISNKISEPAVQINKIQSDTSKQSTFVKVEDRKSEQLEINPIIATEPDSSRQKTNEGDTFPADSSMKTLEIKPLSLDSGSDEQSDKQYGISKDPKDYFAGSKFIEELSVKPFTLPDQPYAELQLLSPVNEMKAGETTRIAVLIKSPKAFRSAVLGLKFDSKKLAVKAITLGEIFGQAFAQKQITPFLNQGGKTYATLSVSQDVGGDSSGVLAYIEIEAIAAGTHEIAFDRDVVNFLTAKGQNFTVKY